MLARGGDPPEPRAALRAPLRYFAETPAAHRAQGPGSLGRYERLAVTRANDRQNRAGESRVPLLLQGVG